MATVKPYPIGGLDKVGIIKNVTPDQIPDGGWSDGLNVRFFGGKAIVLPMYSAFIPPIIESNGRVMHGAQYLQRSGTQYLLVHTLKKTYLYDTATQIFSSIQDSDFTGSADNLFSHDVAYDAYVVTNGKNAIRKWTGTGNIASLGGLTDAEPGGITVNTAAIVAFFNDFVVLINTTEGGAPYPQRVRWSKKGYLEVWKNSSGAGQAGYTDLADEPTPFMGAGKINNYLVLYQKTAIYLMSYVGSPVIFSFSKIASSDKGLLASGALVNLGNIHFYVSSDNIYVFDGSFPIPIGDSIKNYFFGRLHPTYTSRMQSLIQRQFDEIWWIYPSTSSTGDLDSILIYNYRKGTWSFGAIASTAWFLYNQFLDFTWKTIADLSWLFTNGAWSDSLLFSNYPAGIFGDSSGNLFQQSSNYNQAGAAYLKRLVSKYFDFGLPGIDKRLEYINLQTTMGFQNPLRVRVGHLRNAGDAITWGDPQYVNILNGTGKINVDITDVYFVFEFQTDNQADPWEIIGMTAWFSPRGDPHAG